MVTLQHPLKLEQVEDNVIRIISDFKHRRLRATGENRKANDIAFVAP